MNTNELIALCIILIVGALIFSSVIIQFAPEETEVTVLSSSSLYNGESVTVQLTTKNGTPVNNQQITVTICDANGEKNTLNQVTDSEGKSTFEVDGLAIGNYTLECIFGGSNGYAQSKNTITLEIKEPVQTHTLADHPPKNTQEWFNDVWSSERYNDEYSRVTYRDGCVELVPHSQMPYN